MTDGSEPTDGTKIGDGSKNNVLLCGIYNHYYEQGKGKQRGSGHFLHCWPGRRA